MNRESLASRKPGENSVTAFVQNCSSLFPCYFQLQTQIHSEYYSVTPIICSFVAINIKYLYNWYQILDLGFKPVNGYHTQLRSNGGTCRRVRETNDGPRSDVRDDIEETQ